MKKKFLFLYLNTGGGHRAAANVLKQCLADADPETEVTLVNAFDTHNFMGKLFFEKSYHFATNWDPGLYSSFYRMTDSHRFQKLILFFTNHKLMKYFERIIDEEKPTDVIVFHFLVVDAVKRVLKKKGSSARVWNIVLDPFTCHSSWFYRNDINYLVYSELIKADAIRHGIPEQNITVIPFLLGKKFRTLPSPDEVSSLKKKLSLPEDRKILLLSGGGEGLPNMISIVNECVRRRERFTVCVVCGRDVTARRTLSLLAAKERNFSHPEDMVDIRVYGFVDNMDELVKCCDCAVIKAGPASMVEALFQKKPVVLCNFIYGQEIGNVEFAIRNHVGVFKTRSEDILDYVEKLFGDEDYYDSVQNHLNTLPLDVNCDKISNILLKN